VSTYASKEYLDFSSTLQLKIKTRLTKEVLLNPVLTDSEFEKRKAGYWLGWSSKKKVHNLS
jgi:hypothetical protein